MSRELSDVGGWARRILLGTGREKALDELRGRISEDPIRYLPLVHGISVLLRHPEAAVRRKAYACMRAYLEGAWKMDDENLRIFVSGIIMHYVPLYLHLLADPHLYNEVLHDLLVNYALYDDLMPYMVQEVRELSRSGNPAARLAGRALLGVFSWANVTTGAQVVTAEDLDALVEELSSDDPYVLNVLILPVRVVLDSIPGSLERVRKRLIEIVETQEAPNNALYAQVLLEAALREGDADLLKEIFRLMNLIIQDLKAVHEGNELFWASVLRGAEALGAGGARFARPLLRAAASLGGEIGKRAGEMLSRHEGGGGKRHPRQPGERQKGGRGRKGEGP